MEDYDIFISCKREDYEIAEKVYSFLKDNGFNVFLSSKELRRMAQADYMDAISVALDTAYSMIVISTKKEYLTSKWVKFEWSTFLNELLSNRKSGQIMTLAGNLKVSELPIQLRKYESFTLENYKDILPYLKKPEKPTDPQNQDAQIVNNAMPDAELHIGTDIACRVMRFNEELITAQPDIDNLINLKKGSHKLKFISLENEQDNYSLVYTVKNDCEILQVNLAKIRDIRLAKEEEERLTKEEAEHRAKIGAERKRLAEDDAKYEKFEESGKEGFTKDGVVVILAKYDLALPFREGLAAVQLNGKWGYIDKTGKEITPFKYDDTWHFNEGLAVVELNGKSGFIDKIGIEVIPIRYDNAWNFNEGLARVKLKEKYGYIDKIGKEVIPIKYDDAYFCREGLAKVALDGKWGYIDKTGNEVIPIKYDYIRSFRGGLAAVVFKGKCGYIDKSGVEVIPIKYDVAMSFREGLAAVKLNNKWGYIDPNGKEVITIKYDDAQYFKGGLALVQLNGEWGTIDKHGNFIPN